MDWDRENKEGHEVRLCLNRREKMSKASKILDLVGEAYKPRFQCDKCSEVFKVAPKGGKCPKCGGEVTPSE